MSRKNRKINPQRRPKPDTDSVRKAVSGTQAIFFTVLRDKEGYDKDKLLDFWENVNKLSEEIVEGRVSVSDLKRVLREEAEIYI